MMKTFFFAVAVVLVPTIATEANSPPVEYIDKGACPFECCTYRNWDATTDTVAHGRPDKASKVIGMVKAGATVEAITGEVHSNPVRFLVKKAHAEYKPGDILWVYTYLGEGNFKIWRNGEMQEEDLGFSPYGAHRALDARTMLNAGRA